MDIDLIGVGVETKGVKQGSKELDKLDKSATKASRSADNLTKSSTGVSKSSGAAARSIGALAIAYGALRGAKALGGVIDDYTKFNAQLKLATNSQEEFNQALSSVKRIATTAQAEIGSIATLYARLSNSLSELGVQQSKIATISETVALGLKLAGASAGEASSVMLQLSQGFAAGALRGDEFNSMAENAPSLMKALAASMGVTTGALREMAANGEITREVLLKAFGDQELLNTYREHAKEVTTISGAWQAVANNITLAIGKADEYLGLSAKIKERLGGAADLFSPESDGSKKASAQQEIWRLQRILDSGASGFAGQSRDDMTGKIRLLRKQFFSTGDGNSIASGGLGGGGFAPNFGSTVETQDIREIHKAQAERERLAKEYTKTQAELVDEQARKEFESIKKVAEARDEMLKANKEYAAKLEKEEHETKQKWVDLEQKRALDNFKEAQAANKKFEDERRREAEKTSDFLTRSITDGLMRGFESGKSFAQNFIDTLKNMFKSLVLQPIVKFLVDSSGITKVLGAIGGAFSGSASASGAAGGGSSVTSLLGGFKDILSSGNASVVSSIESLGAFLSTGNGGLGDMLGGAIGQYSSQIANVLPYAGAALQLLSGDVKGAAFTGAGTAIGSALGGPIGGAIGGAIGKFVGGLFGGKSYDRYGTTVSGFQYAGEDYRKTGQGIIYDKDVGAGGQLNALNSAFSNTLSTLLRSFGADQNISTYSGVSQRGKSGKSGWYFASNLVGSKSDMVKGSAQDAFRTLSGKVMGEFLLTAIKRSKLTDGIKKFFDGVKGQDAIVETINSIIAVKNSLTDLPQVFRAIQFELDTTLFKSSGAQLTARFQALSNYTNLFYSETEKLDTAFKQITTQFSALGQTLPSSRDEFRALIDGFDVFDEASANTFYGLVALAPALDTYYNALTNQKDALDALNAAMRDSNSFSNIIDFQRYQSTATNFGSTSANTLLSDSPAVIGILSQLRDEIINLRTTSAATAKSSQTTADLLNNVTLGGEALQTQAAA